VRLTIERLRTLVLVFGALLVIAIALFLAISHWRNISKTIDLPSKLGVNITEQADHVIYTQTHSGHTLFKIDAAKVVQVSNGLATLSDVKIDLYGAEGSRVDRIEGKQFEYDQKSGIAKAIGPVEITLMKPGQAPIIAPKATTHAIEEKTPKNTTLSNAVATAETGDIRVKTSGLIFNQKSGVAQTVEHVDFLLKQGEGSGTGALFDSQQGHMVLDHNVELHIRRGDKSDSDPVTLHASHAEFERGSLLCHLRNASLNQRATTADAAAATILFREDGSADKLDASGGVTIASTSGATITAPRGHLEFDPHNHPIRGHMDDGVTLDSKESRTDANGKLNRTMHGTAPSAQLAFTALGDLHTAHLERGVDFNTLEDRNQSIQQNHTLRHWNSPIADLEFQKNAKGGVTLKSIHGIGGTTIKGESQRTLITGSLNHVGPTLPSRLASDDLVGIFNAQGALDSLTGTGHSIIEETTETGAHQLATGDKLDAHFIDETHTQSSKAHTSTTPATGLSNLDHATLVGHVVLVQTPPASTANKSANSTTASNNAPIRATSGRADYEGAGEWLHLTLSPRVENGGVEMTAERIDVSRASGDAFAHTNVKASWISEKSPSEKSPNAKSSSDKSATAGLGGQGPTHVVSTEAELRQSTNEAIFSNQARLWQGSNSVAAPIITLNREHQTLFAEGAPTKSKPTAEPPVYAVFLSAAAPKSTNSASHSNTPQLMRFHGAHLKYSAAERKAWLTTSSIDTNSAVTADTGSGRVQSDSMELTLLPVGVTNSGPTSEGSTSQVDHLTAHGHVQLNSSGRHGTGEQLLYSGETGEYTLTGTAANPPKLNDPTRGTVTGETLIFQSRNDSVKVVGPGTSTETTTQK
jgi:lipopolysaccharide export system protein LptA